MNGVDNATGILTLPTFEANSLYRWVANATLAYFENPEVQARFEQWKKERKEEIEG